MKKRSLTIAVLGPDGSGKSTLIDEITCANLPFEEKYYFHLKPIYSKEANNENQRVDNPHFYPLYSPLKSYLKLIYFLYQYNTGYRKNIVKLISRSSIIIFDRYYDDILADQKRYRYGGSIMIAKWIKRYIPKLDLYIILYAKPDVIFKRKKEVQYNELKRQLASYESLADGKKYFLVNAAKDPKEIAAEVIELIKYKMNE